MFAGAAREAVFSNPDVIARIEKDFIPVALKAATVMHPPAGPEGDLYRELKRTQPAPQGICVVNASGRVLAWSLMFEDDASVLGFLDHAVARYGKHPDATKPTPAERYMRYPNQRLPDLPAADVTAHIPTSHAADDRCPGELLVPEGALVATVVGRALDADGKPLSNARTQDHYVEDRFHIPREVQHALADAAKRAKGEPFRLPHQLTRLLVGHAYLGMLDVDPLREQKPGDTFELWAKHVGTASRLHVWGTSHVAARRRDRQDGATWEHAVTLTWTGAIDLGSDGSIRDLAAMAHGNEVLRWGRQGNDPRGSDVAHLPAGRPIDFDGRVRYGIVSKR